MEPGTSQAPVDVSKAPPEAQLLRELEDAFALRFDEPEVGEGIARRVMDVAEAAGFDHALAAAVTVFAYTSDIGDAPPDALEQLQHAYRTLDAVGDELFAMRCADMLCTIFEGMGDLATSLGYAEVVLDRARATGNLRMEICALSSLGGIFTATGELDSARAKVERGLELARQIGDKRLESRLELRRSNTSLRGGDLEGARAQLARVIDLALEAGALFTKYNALSELGRVHEASGDFALAERVLEEVLACEDNDIQEVIVPKARVILGRVYLATDRPELARACLAAAESATFFRMWPTLAEAARLLAETHQRLGEADLALAQYRRHIQLRDEIRDVESLQAVQRFQVRAAQREAEQERLRYAKLEAMQTQLVEAERMAAVGSLAAGIAHEMNSPLGVIQTGLDTVERAKARIQDALTDIAAPRAEAALSALSAARATSISALERLDGLVSSLRRFTRLDEAEVQAVDLTEGLREAIVLLRPTLPPGLRVEQALDPVPRIVGWPARINQAFVCLLMNAVEAQPQGGLIRVESRGDGDLAIVRIRDHGPGIPPEIQPQLFEIAFDGSGARTRFRVGLATVREVVRRHGGEIDFETSERGTTFELRFPIDRRLRR